MDLTTAALEERVDRLTARLHDVDDMSDYHRIHRALREAQEDLKIRRTLEQIIPK